ncbi:TetR/AcrR family transcriptional regulator C-terminal domain-containing protein [Streptomyces asiaticus]|uniref:TetR/AcrR family transcriptional regulator C-terminal domain-containing protein n=1 Tax=Streptomyces asiaticus TaxID=114695 RepID=UPI003811ADFC
MIGPAAQVSLNRRLSKDGADTGQLMADAMAHARETAMRFPRLRERLGTTAAAPDDTFAFGLQSILDGFEARLTADRASRHE